MVKFDAVRSGLPVRTTTTDQRPEGPRAKEAPLRPSLVPAELRRLPKGDKRRADQQTAGLHVRMASMLGQISGFLARADRAIQSGVHDLERSLNMLADAVFGPVAQPQLALAGAHGGAYTSEAQAVTPKGGTVMFASIRDMLKGHGRLQRECPGEYLDADYDQVVKDAKGGDQKAKKAKKLAEQGKRLSGKLKGKK